MKKKFGKTKPNKKRRKIEKEDPEDVFPALAIRKQPQARRGKKKKRTFLEYYDFTTSLLTIEVHHMAAADPFVDPKDWP